MNRSTIFWVCLLALLAGCNGTKKLVKSGISLNYTRGKDVLPGIYGRNLLKDLNGERINGENEVSKSVKENDIGKKGVRKNGGQIPEITNNGDVPEIDKNSEIQSKKSNESQKVKRASKVHSINKKSKETVKEKDNAENEIKNNDSRRKLPENLKIRFLENYENLRKSLLNEMSKYVVPYNGNTALVNNNNNKSRNDTEKLPVDDGNVTVIIVSSENDDGFSQIPKEIRHFDGYLSKILNGKQIENNKDLGDGVVGFDGKVVKLPNQTEVSDGGDLPKKVSPDEGILTRLRKLFSTITGNMVKLPAYYQGDLKLPNGDSENDSAKLPTVRNGSKDVKNENSAKSGLTKLPENSNLTELNQFLSPAYYQDYNDYYTSQCLATDWATPTQCQYDSDCCSLSCCQSNLCTPFFLSIPCKVSKAVNSIP